MRTALFDFELPAENIALRPARPRDAARMLVVPPGEALQDQIVSDLPQALRPGDQLVVNDTKVIAAQLTGRRIGRDIDGAQRLLARRIEGNQPVSGCKPDLPAVIGDPIDAVDARKRSILANDFGR